MSLMHRIDGLGMFINPPLSIFDIQQWKNIATMLPWPLNTALRSIVKHVQDIPSHETTWNSRHVAARSAVASTKWPGPMGQKPTRSDDFTLQATTSRTNRTQGWLGDVPKWWKRRIMGESHPWLMGDQALIPPLVDSVDHQLWLNWGGLLMWI